MTEPRGATFAAAHVVDFLTEALPKRILADRLRRGLSEDDLPLPEAYLPHEPLAVDRTPMIAVTVDRGETQRVEHRGGDANASSGGTFAVTYSARIFCWCVGKDLPSAVRQRNDLAVAVRATLLDAQTFGASAENTRIEEQTLVEEYSDTARTRGDRFLAGAFVGFEMTVFETIDGEATSTIYEPVQVDLDAGGTSPMTDLGDVVTLPSGVAFAYHADERNADGSLRPIGASDAPALAVEGFVDYLDPETPGGSTAIRLANGACLRLPDHARLGGDAPPTLIVVIRPTAAPAAETPVVRRDSPFGAWSLARTSSGTVRASVATAGSAPVSATSGTAHGTLGFVRDHAGDRVGAYDGDAVVYAPATGETGGMGDLVIGGSDDDVIEFVAIAAWNRQLSPEEMHAAVAALGT